MLYLGGFCPLTNRGLLVLMVIYQNVTLAFIETKVIHL